MSAKLARFTIGVHHHRRRVPAYHRSNAVLDRLVSRYRALVRQRYGIDVSGFGRKRQVCAGAAGFIDQAFEQEVRSFRSLAFEYRIQRFDPFLGFFRINISFIYHVRCLCCKLAGLYSK
jgi:hypothetical protein